MCTSKVCSRLMHLSWSEGSSVHSATHSWLLMAWTIFWFPILYGLLPLGAGLCLIVGFSSFNLLFCSFRSLATIPTVPLCHSCCVMLFDPCLLGLFHWIYTHVALGFLVPLHYLWAPLSHFLLLGHPRPICFPWASSAHFLILHSHELLLTFLDFPGPITISFIFEAHWFTISFSRLLLGPFASLKAHLLILWAYNPLFLPFGFNDFSNHPLTLVCPYYWASSCY